MAKNERAAYIRGLMDGLQLDPEAKETKVLNAIVDLLDDLCADVVELEDQVDTLTEQVDEIDEDLGSLEEEVYDFEGCEGCGRGFPEDEDAEFEVNCPSCGKSILLTDDMLEDGEIICPGCGEKLSFELEDEPEEEE